MGLTHGEALQGMAQERRAALGTGEHDLNVPRCEGAAGHGLVDSSQYVAPVPVAGNRICSGRTPSCRHLCRPIESTVRSIQRRCRVTNISTVRGARAVRYDDLDQPARQHAHRRVVAPRPALCRTRQLRSGAPSSTHGPVAPRHSPGNSQRSRRARTPSIARASRRVRLRASSRRSSAPDARRSEPARSSGACSWPRAGDDVDPRAAGGTPLRSGSSGRDRR